MFTGLVEELGKVKALVRGAKSVRLTVAAQKILSDVKIGDSIAVNGTCLTVVAYGDTWFTVDVMPETVERTVLVALKPGDAVNLERTLRLGDRFGGHIVSGHIDGTGSILAMKRDDNAVVVRIEAKPEIMKYIIKKGSIAIDGISLTVVDYGANWFTVSLIPHTAAMTTLGIKTTGDSVNLENDMIGKYVEKLLGLKDPPNNKPVALTQAFLQENGFTL
ncbi:MAG: riboflavin synthase [Veillonellales bacterium]